MPWTINRNKPVTVGECSSCHTRPGTSRTIPNHPGQPILCDTCYPKRRARMIAIRDRNVGFKLL